MGTLLRVNREIRKTIIFLATLLCAQISSVGSSAGDFETFTAEDVFFEILDPPELSYTYRLRPALDFGTPFNDSLSRPKMALVPVEPEIGCSEPINKAELEGNVALVLRGECSFFEKSIVAEKAGARAVIIADYHVKSHMQEIDSPMYMDQQYVDMTKNDDAGSEEKVNIPAGFLLGKNGRMIRETLQRLNLPHALIKIPLNFTFAPLKDFHQPPWHLL